MNKCNLRGGRAVLFGAAAAVAIGIVSPALANGGGGGGGGSMPMPSSRNVNPQESFRDGIAALEARDFKKAEKKFGEVLSAAPKHPEANYYMGLAKVGLGKQKQAVKYFEKAIDARAQFTEAREQLALVSIQLADLDTANAQLAALKEQQTACGSDCSPAYSQRLAQAIATVEAALAPPAAAETPVEGAAEEETPSTDEESAPEEEDTGANDQSQFSSLFFETEEAGVARYRGAVRLINEARYEDAIKTLYEAQAIIGPHPDILNYLGYSNRKLGLFDKAQDYYAQALSLDPAHLGANEYLGELYLEIGEMDKARARLAKLEALCPFGCADREDLARLIAIKEATRSAAKD